MKELAESFSSLQQNADRLLSRYNEQVERFKKLELVLTEKENEFAALMNENERLTKENQILKMASAVGGSEENRTEAKRKINELVREIDKCISMMSK